jgi:long-subunit acyl-CoA synthetase (AMP-forming)
MTERLGIADGDVYPVAWPITHIGGASVLNAVLRCGGQLVLFESFDPDTFGERAAATKPTILGTGTPFFRSYIQAQRRHPDQPVYPDLRVFTAGGAPTPPEIISALVDTFGVAGVVNSWGLTEFPIAACPPQDAPARKLLETVGPPSPGVQVRVVEGELRLKGPQCFLGYVDEGHDGEAFDEEGWFVLVT